MAKRVFESDRPRSGRVSLAIIFVFPKVKPRDTKRREDKGELRPRNLLSVCYRNAKGLRYFPISPVKSGKMIETYPINHPERHRRTICRCKSFSIGCLFARAFTRAK